MTTPPKARVFRTSREESVLSVKRSPGAVEIARKVQISVRKRDDAPSAGSARDRVAADPSQLFAPPPDEDGFGGMRFPGAAPKAALKAWIDNSI